MNYCIKMRTTVYQPPEFGEGGSVSRRVAWTQHTTIPVADLADGEALVERLRQSIQYRDGSTNVERITTLCAVVRTGRTSIIIPVEDYERVTVHVQSGLDAILDERTRPVTDKAKVGMARMAGNDNDDD